MKMRHAFAVIALAAGALIGAPSAAADVTVNQTIPTTYTGTDSCTHEDFIGTGNVHWLLSENVSTTGNVNFNWEVRIDGLQAIGVVSGKKYIVQDTFVLHDVFAGATVQDFDIVAHYVRVGEDNTLILGDDFYEYLRTHITANDQGMVTSANVQTNDVPCQ